MFGHDSSLSGIIQQKLMEAHEGELRALALTADGSKLATASVKGTVIRVWDVYSSTCLQEFRRGVERTTITCLAWSWDNEWLSCTSDKGTAHIFQLGGFHEENGKKSGGSTSLTQMFFSSVRKSVEGDAKKSVWQIRGVPHPQACAFCSDAPNLIAVAGWDADGNGVLLLSEFAVGEEPKRVAYHVLCKSAVQEESDEARRRRRLRGWTPEIPQTPEGGRLYVGERLEVLERGMEQIQFEEKDEFVSVTAIRNDDHIDNDSYNDTGKQFSKGGNDDAENTSNEDGKCGHDVVSSQHTDELQSNSNRDSGTVGDSVRTEPLDDEVDASELQ